MRLEIKDLIGEKRLWVHGSPNAPACKIVTCEKVDENDRSVLVSYRHQGVEVHSWVPVETFLEMK